jgi:5-oxoprolinase (ATP-hydrolysing)
VRELEFVSDMTCSILSERRALAPFGLEGGGPGKRGKNMWFSKREGLWRNVGGKRSWDVQQGDVVRIETPGGGGFGEPTEVVERSKL